MPDKKKTTKPAKKEKDTSKKETDEKEEKNENPHGGLPDVDFKKFLGCGG